METVRAIFENGVFRPLSSPELPEHCEVVFVPQGAPVPKPVEGAPDPNRKDPRAIIGFLKDAPDVADEILQVVKERVERPRRIKE